MSDPKFPSSEPFPDGKPEDATTRDDAFAAEAMGSIGPYRLLQKIGEGGMGEVWLAEQTQPFHRRVALKIIKAGMDTKQVIARFEAERQALAMMHHSCVAKVFDAGSTPEGRPYFVMEYVAGVPITEHCDRNKLTTDERVELFTQVCDGVQHAHQKAIIHRDLKPSNVLVSIQDGTAVPKIIDFGVAKATAQKLTEKTLFTEMGVLIGTPEYMSPEQADLTVQDVDTRTDVYSLGVMLYELLVGDLPFATKELRSVGLDGIRRMIREVEPEKPSTRLSKLGKDRSTDSAKHRRVDVFTLRRQLSGDLDWITMKALEKDRGRRYGSPADLAADLRRNLRDEPVVAGPPSTVYRMRKFVRRHRVGVAAAAAAVMVLIGFAATMTVQARRIAAARDQADRERDASDKVSEFLANMLGNVEPRAIGTALWTDLHERVAAARRGRGASKEGIDAALVSLDDVLAGVNPTDAALRLLDEQVLARAGQTIGKEMAAQPRVAGRLERTLGDTYLKLGLYGPAELHAKRAAEILERTFGIDHPDTLRSRSSLANVYYDEGRYAEAEKLDKGTLEIQRRVLGKDHPDTLKSMVNLANDYRVQERYSEAEKLGKETLESQRRVLGHDHRDTLKSMYNLAVGYKLQERNAEAEQLYKETLEIQRRALGRDHHDTLVCMNGLASMYRIQGRYTEAEQLFKETLEIQRRVQGQDHPSTLTSMNNLAIVYGAQGRYAEAEQLFKESLEIKRRVLGQDHPYTLLPMCNLACIAALRGDRKQALDWLKQAVDHGWKNANMLSDNDQLKSLRGDPAFEKLVARARENGAKSK